MFLYNSTVAFNTATAYTVNPQEKTAAGIFVAGAAHFQSSIIFGNKINSTPYDLNGNGSIIGANNLIGVSPTLNLPADTLHSNPLLGPLQDNGGPTFTRALLKGSPAIDAGKNATSSSFDQRGNGFVRTSGKATDIGAFETQDTIFANGFD